MAARTANGYVQFGHPRPIMKALSFGQPEEMDPYRPLISVAE